MDEHWLEMRYDPVLLSKNILKQKKKNGFTLAAPKA